MRRDPERAASLFHVFLNTVRDRHIATVLLNFIDAGFRSPKKGTLLLRNCNVLLKMPLAIRLLHALAQGGA
jgi:hypothetical protein